MVRRIRIATRASRLAVWQAQYVQEMIESRLNCATTLVTVTSKGDELRDRPISEIGEVGVFTKEVQQALLEETADAAVHSLKDLPTESIAGLCLAATPARGPVHDVLLAPQYCRLADMPQGARLATSSLRRRAQLLRHRPDLAVVDIRGNVETRVNKLRNGHLDGVVLAAAGIERLGLQTQVTESFSIDFMLPAVGQGALGIECRNNDPELRRMLMVLDDVETRAAVNAERAFLRQMQGGCHVPIGAYATVVDQQVVLRGLILSLDGRAAFSGRHCGHPADSEQVGIELAQRLLDQGARSLAAVGFQAGLDV